MKSVVEEYDSIKRITVIAIFSDDELLEHLVLKGGNALDLIYNIAGRASLDIDFSISKKFEDIKNLSLRIEETLKKTFDENGYVVFDYQFSERPPEVSEDMADFWGGYRVRFKVIKKDLHEKFNHDLQELRKYAQIITEGNEKNIYLDISKYEFCGIKRREELNGYTIYVYTPEMLVIEKLRAICQQMPAYGVIVKSKSQSARARDFYDIHVIVKKFKIDITSDENLKLIESIFEAKRVPLKLIGDISEFREVHRSDFDSVKNTIKIGMEIEEFDFYFDFLIDMCQPLKSLWIK